MSFVTLGCLASVARGDEAVIVCGPQPNKVFSSQMTSSFDVEATCPNGNLKLSTDSVEGFTKGQNALWHTTAPPGLMINAVWVAGMLASGVNAGSSSDYGGTFYWTDGSSPIKSGESSAWFPAINAHGFGFNLVCGVSTCSGANAYAGIFVYQINLDVSEAASPSLASATGLWQTSGWVRGKWNVILSGDSPSGMCGLGATFAGQPLPGSSSLQDTSVWHQCAAAPIDDPVQTADYPDGSQELTISGTDAAGQTAQLTKTVYLDNQQPTVSLTGPTDAPSTAGTQYVSATATAGPSGVAGMSCSTDDAPAQWFGGSTAQIPVSGVGEHQVTCTAVNNALDANGNHGTSQPETFAMKIGMPTEAAVAFSKVVDKLKCHKVTERVRLPARWVKVKVKGKVIRVHERARTVRVKVTRCHARTVKRRITQTVTVVRHGKKVRVKRSRIVRVVLAPHNVLTTRQRVRHGHGTTVYGWLATSDGVALADQPVEVLTAADNGRNNFHVAATTTTAANGGWSAELPPGPSRLIEAAYPGSATTEATGSLPAHLVVPAKVELLSVRPRHVAWGGQVRLVGRLKGGYLPPGGALIRLRIGIGSARTTYGIQEHVRGNGRFRTTYRFGAGVASIRRTYWFQIASLPMGDYPYAPADSRKVDVTVGG